MSGDRYPREWVHSDDFAQQFCGRCQMITRNIQTVRDLAEAVAWLASYRRAFYTDLKYSGFSIH
jgi:hypothetical protein